MLYKCIGCSVKCRKLLDDRRKFWCVTSARSPAIRDPSNQTSIRFTRVTWTLSYTSQLLEFEKVNKLRHEIMFPFRASSDTFRLRILRKFVENTERTTRIVTKMINPLYDFIWKNPNRESLLIPIPALSLSATLMLIQSCQFAPLLISLE